MDEKKKGGSPEHVPTEESRAKVADFTCAGFTQTDIAKYFNIDDKTLRKHYRDELDKAKLEMIRGLSQNAYRMALGGSEKCTCPPGRKWCGGDSCWCTCPPDARAGDACKCGPDGRSWREKFSGF